MRPILVLSDFLQHGIKRRLTSQSLVSTCIILFLSLATTLNAQEVKTLDDLAKLLRLQEAKLKNLEFSVESYTSAYSKQSGQFVKSVLPSIVTVRTDGLSCGKFLIEYKPRVIPTVNVGMPFTSQYTNLSFDGRALYTLLVSAQNAKGDQASLASGRIEDSEAKSVRVDPWITGLAFTMYGLPSLRGNEITSLANLDSKVEFSNVKLEDGSDCLLLMIASKPHIHKFWLDTKRNYALRRYEVSHLYSGGSEGKVVARYEVSALEPLGPEMSFMPTEMSFTSFLSNGMPLQKVEAKIKGILFNQAWTDKDFTLLYPPSTLIEDRRLHIEFRTGDQPSRLSEKIKDSLK